MNNKRFRFCQSFCMICIICLTVKVSKADITPERWTGNSWVDLHYSATAESKVLERLVLNTEVKLVESHDEWCNVVVQGKNVRGFIQCNTLVSRPVLLDEIGFPKLQNGAPNPHYSATGSFWLAPSMHRLIDAGNYFWESKLTEDQRNLEHPALNGLDTQKAQETWRKSEDTVRYPIPEFETMKNLLKSGVVSADENRPAIRKFKEFIRPEKSAVPNTNNTVGSYSIDQGEKRVLQSIMLVPIKSSLFANDRELAPAWSTIEELSAQFGIKEHMRILGGPQWVSIDDEGPHVTGSWDIGTYDLILAQPIFRHVIDRNGQKISNSFIPLEHHDVSKSETDCREGFVPDREGVTHLTSASGNDHLNRPEDLSLAIWFYTAGPLPDRQVKVKKFGQIVDMPPRTDGNNQPRPHALVITYTMDLDADGIADVAQLEISNGDEYGDSASELLTLANIAGSWTLLSVEYNNKECD